MFSWLSLLTVICQFWLCFGSLGDKCNQFRYCLQVCKQLKCQGKKKVEFDTRLQFHMKLLNWHCDEECKYTCMWEVVQEFQDYKFGVPQFYGKWPFIRILGIQEPASALFSVLNAVPHIIMLLKFRRDIPSSAPMYYMVHLQGVFAINAWFWSLVFHSRDTPFTEKMDYFCADAYILVSIYYLCVRILGTEKPWKHLLCAFVIIVWFVRHIHYLGFIKFDYGYNIKAMVVIGFINTFGWIVWSFYHGQRYTRRCVTTMLTTSLLLTLELGDFAPIFWLFDAHSMWHAGTIPLPFLMYRFFIDDCRYMLNKKRDTLKIS